MPIDLERLLGRMEDLTRRVSRAERLLDSPSVAALIARDRADREQHAIRHDVETRAAEVNRTVAAKTRREDARDPAIVVRAGQNHDAIRAIRISRACERVGISADDARDAWFGRASEWAALVAAMPELAAHVDAKDVIVSRAPVSMRRRILVGGYRHGLQPSALDAPRRRGR